MSQGSQHIIVTKSDNNISHLERSQEDVNCPGMNRDLGFIPQGLQCNVSC